MSAPVSVIMSTFNREKYIAEAVNGLLDQTCPPRQIIIINDGSTDGTDQVLATFGNRIVSISQENTGKSVAINKALSMADGDYIWIFDDDDIPFPDALERHLHALSDDPAAGFTYGPHRLFQIDDQGNRVEQGPMDFPDLSPNEVFPRLLEGCFFSQLGSLVRAECFRAVGDYRTELTRSLDYDFLLRLAREFRGVRIEKPTFFLRVHQGQRGTASASFEAGERSLHWYLADQIIFQELYDQLELWEYLPHEPGSSAPSQFDISLALMTRASIMGAKGLWVQSIEDLERILREDRLSKIQTSKSMPLLKQMLSVSPAIGDLVADRQSLPKLMSMGRKIDQKFFAFSIARRAFPAFRMAYRERDFHRLRRMSSVLLKNSGPSAIFKALTNKFGLSEYPNLKLAGTSDADQA